VFAEAQAAVDPAGFPLLRQDSKGTEVVVREKLDEYVEPVR
jgi:hypothetical protein